MPRLHRVQVTAVAIAFLLVPSVALAAQKPTIRINVAGNCAGDTVSGRITVRAPAGTTFTVRLLRQPRAGAGWMLTGRARRFTNRSTSRSYRVRFDVSPFDAHAYRLAVDRRGHRTVSQPIPATSCAPGAQVPEAPFALLLPLSLLGTGSLLLLRRRAPR